MPAEDEGDRDDDGSDGDDGAPSGPSDGSEDKASRKKKKEKEAKKKKAAPAPAKAAPRHVSAAIARLKAVAKAATVTVPPSLYVKHKGDAELQAALEDLLAGHGLSAASEPADTARIKRKLVAARELDGIDTSNIVQGGRGSRRAGENGLFGGWELGGEVLGWRKPRSALNQPTPTTQHASPVRLFGHAQGAPPARRQRQRRFVPGRARR